MNGTRVAIKSASDSEKKHALLIIFDPNTGSQIRSIPLPENDISLFSDPTLTDDGKLVAASSSNGDLQVWSVETGENLFAETIPDARAGFLQFDQRGTMLAGTFFLPDHRRVTKVFRLADGQLLGTMDGSPSRLAFSPDGNLLALSSYGGGPNGNRLEVFDVSANCNLLWSIPTGESNGVAPHFSGDGRWLACCVGTGVRTFGSRTGAESHLTRGHAAPIEALGFREQSSNLITVDAKGVLKEWQSLDDQFDNKTISLDRDPLVMSDEWTQPNALYVRHPQKDSRKLRATEIDEKDQQAIVGDMTGRVLMRVPTAEGRVFGASIDRDGEHIAVVDFSLDRPATEAACVRVFDVGSQRELSRIYVPATVDANGPFHSLPLPNLLLSPAGNTLAVSSPHPDQPRRWTVALYDSRSRQTVSTCEDSNNEPWRYLRWSPCGRWLAGAFDENVLRTSSTSTTPTFSTFVRIWSAETGKMLWERRTPGCDFFRFADQGELAFGIEIRSSKPWFLVWDIKSGEEVHSVALLERLSADNSFYFAKFDKLTQRAFVAQRTRFGRNIIDLLDLSGPGGIIRTFEPVTLGKRSSISLAVAPDGKRLATSEVNFIGSSGGQTQLWDTESGKVLLTIPFAASRLEFNKAESELYGRRFDYLPGLLHSARWSAAPLASTVEAR